MFPADETETVERQIQQAVLRHIERGWRKLGKSRPWGMWITEHAPIPTESQELDYARMPALRALFLRESGLQPRSPWEFQRFFVVHFLQPWCQQRYREPEGFLDEAQYPIGFASFARYIESEDFYLELNYGRLWGRCYRLTVAAEGNISEAALWWS